MGIKAVMHDKNRTTWGHKGKTGWYVGPALEHYRCLTMYVPTSRAVRVSDTVELLPEKIELPNFTINEAIANTLAEIRDMLKKCPPTNVGDDELDAIRELARIFQQYNTKILNKQKNTSISPVQTKQYEPCKPSTRTHEPHIIPDDTIHTNAIFHPETGKEIKYLEAITKGPNKDVWNKSAANEFGRLAQGVANRIKGTYTIFFIHSVKILRI